MSYERIEPIHGDWADYCRAHLPQSTEDEKRKLEEVLALLKAGVDAVNLVHAERHYGLRQRLMDEAKDAFDEHARSAMEAGQLVEKGRHKP